MCSIRAGDIHNIKWKWLNVRAAFRKIKMHERIVNLRYYLISLNAEFANLHGTD